MKPGQRLKRITAAAAFLILFLLLFLSGRTVLEIALEDADAGREYSYVREAAAPETAEEGPAAFSPAPEEGGMTEDGAEDLSERYGLPVVDEEKLLSMNPEYAAWLYVPEADIDFPVVSAPDNQKYLRRTFLGEPNSSGCLFFDKGNSPDSSKNLIIHGHNMRNGSMFGRLKEFADDDFAGKEAEAFLFIKGRWKRYLLFSSVIVSNTDPYPYTSAFSSAADFDTFLSYLTDNSVQTYPALPEGTHNILSLSTCCGKNKKLICSFFETE